MSDSAKKNCFKEAVCIEAMRVFDSCSSQDCLEDLTVDFDPSSQAHINNASHVKSKCVEVIDAAFTVDTVPFNKGFYSVDITYTFKIDLEVYPCNGGPVKEVTGIARFSKKVILFGSEGNTKQFTSDETSEPDIRGCCNTNSMPRAAVSVVDPIVLDIKLLCNPCPPRPKCNIDCSDGQGCDKSPSVEVSVESNKKAVKLTIGLFSIVKLERPVPVLIPVYDYCIPLKECSNTSDSPCEIFEKINFPTAEFFPKGLEDAVGCCTQEEISEEE